MKGMTQLTRPAIGVMVDPERMAAARKSAMLERIELAHLSQVLDLRKIASDEGVDVADCTDASKLRKMLAEAGVAIKRPGVSRDEIAKLETGGRKRPKITTMRKLIETLNYARGLRGKPPLDIEDLQVPGEVLIPASREEPVRDILAREAEEAEAVADEQKRAQALSEYQQVSNEIYYQSEGKS